MNALVREIMENGANSVKQAEEVIKLSREISNNTAGLGFWGVTYRILEIIKITTIERGDDSEFNFRPEITD